MKTQQGVSIIITFLIMTLIAIMVLSLSTVLVNQLKAAASTADTVSAWYAAESGIEKTLYSVKKQGEFGQQNGFCNVCNSCTGSGCQLCTLKPISLAQGDSCSLSNCQGCQLRYQAFFDGRTYNIDAQLKNGQIMVQSQGSYKDSKKTVEFTTGQ